MTRTQAAAQFTFWTLTMGGLFAALILGGVRIGWGA